MSLRLKPFTIEFHDRLGRFTKHTFYAASRGEALNIGREWALKKFPGRQFRMQ